MCALKTTSHSSQVLKSLIVLNLNNRTESPIARSRSPRLSLPTEANGTGSHASHTRKREDRPGRGEIRRLIDAVEHYEAYLHSQQRDETRFRELLVRLSKMLGKRSSGGSE